MTGVDPLLLLHAATAVAWGTAGAVACRARNDVEAALGTGLVTGAVLTALDTLLAGRGALPLGAWALLAFAAAALVPNARVAARIVGSPPRRALAAAAVFFALHLLHGARSRQPVVEWGTSWQPLAALAAAALGWLAWSCSRRASSELTLVLGGTAVGLAAGAFGGAVGEQVGAACHVLAVLPMALHLARADGPAVRTALAVCTSAAFAMLLRTGAGSFSDPMLVVAVLFVAFGLASPRRAAPPAAAPSAPPTPHALSAHAVVRDLRDPLTTVLAAAGVLRQSHDPQQRDEQVATILDEGKHLTTLLADLDDFEALVKGDLRLAHDSYDVERLLHGCVSEAAAPAAAHGLEVRLDVATSLPRWLQGDRERVHQLVRRLLEITLQNTTMSPVDVSASADARTFHLVVLDRGAGHPAQAPGLGITFCKQLALAMGGELTVRPRPDLGSELHLRLPKHEAPTWEVELLEQDAERSAGAAATRGMLRGKVLLVDDSRDHQRLIGHLLSLRGADVTTADSGEVALHLLQSVPFDLVLLDMQMPGMDGYTTVRRVRELGLRTPVLALTADTSHQDVERCLAAGCNGHLPKPVDPAALHDTMALHLQTWVR